MNGKQKSILVVDDEGGVLNTLQSILEEKGFLCRTAISGREALDIFQKEGGIDCVLTDLRMPGMGGVEVIREFKKLKPDIPVIVITACEGEDPAREAMKEGAAAVVYKPFDMESLLRLIGEVLK